MSEVIKRRFLNQHGESWELTVDPETRSGTLAGDETDGGSVPVYGGSVYEIILSAEEQAQLQSLWDDICETLDNAVMN
jgi:hypothetical protein